MDSHFSYSGHSSSPLRMALRSADVMASSSKSGTGELSKEIVDAGTTSANAPKTRLWCAMICSAGMTPSNVLCASAANMTE